MFIKDEIGFERKFEEVSRIAKNKEFIKVLVNDLFDDAREGDILEVEVKNDTVFIKGKTTVLSLDEYVVLEATDIYRIDGKLYTKLNRRAIENDVIVIVKKSERKGYDVGEFGRVLSEQGDRIIVKFKNETHSVWGGEYMVVTPLETKDTVDARVLARFDEAQKGILASSSISLEDAFHLILQIERLKFKK